MIDGSKMIDGNENIIMQSIKIEPTSDENRDKLVKHIEQFLDLRESNYLIHPIRLMQSRLNSEVDKKLHIPKNLSNFCTYVLASMHEAKMSLSEQMDSVRSLDSSDIREFSELEASIGTREMHDYFLFTHFSDKSMLSKFYFSYILTIAPLNVLVKILIELCKAEGQDYMNNLPVERILKIVDAVNESDSHYPIEWIVAAS